VIAAFFSSLGPLLLGAVLDNYGPRICSIVSTLFVICGLILFSISDVTHLPMFIPAMSMVAFGGPGVQNAIIHLSNLFPGWKATATAVMTGSFQLSFIVFFIFDQLWVFKDWTFQQLFLSYCLVCVANIVISACLWPDTPYHHEESAPTDPGEEDDGEIVSSRITVVALSLHNLTFAILRSRRIISPWV
jgi:MFS family permease